MAGEVRSDDYKDSSGGNTAQVNGGLVIGGTYTPTVSNSSGCTATVSDPWTYFRFGNVVNVSGYFEAGTSSADFGNGDSFQVTVPVNPSSNFNTLTLAHGGFLGDFTNGSNILSGGTVKAISSTNNVLLTNYGPNSAAQKFYSCNFSYRIDQD